VQDAVRVGVGQRYVAVEESDSNSVDDEAKIAGAAGDPIRQYFGRSIDFQAVHTVGSDRFAIEVIGDAEVGLRQQSRGHTQNLSVSAGRACICSDCRYIQLDHALARLNRREVVASVRIRQGIDAIVQRDHCATDAGLAAVLPAVAVQILEDLANDRAQIKDRIRTDFEFCGCGRRSRTYVAGINCDRNIRVKPGPGTGTNDHRVSQDQVPALARIGNAIAIRIAKRLHITNVEERRRTLRRICNGYAIESRCTSNISKHRCGCIRDAHAADDFCGRILNFDPVIHDVADRGTIWTDRLGQLQYLAQGKADIRLIVQ